MSAVNWPPISQPSQCRRDGQPAASPPRGRQRKKRKKRKATAVTLVTRPRRPSQHSSAGGLAVPAPRRQFRAHRPGPQRAKPPWAQRAARRRNLLSLRSGKKFARYMPERLMSPILLAATLREVGRSFHRPRRWRRDTNTSDRYQKDTQTWHCDHYVSTPRTELVRSGVGDEAARELTPRQPTTIFDAGRNPACRALESH